MTAPTTTTIPLATPCDLDLHPAESRSDAVPIARWLTPASSAAMLNRARAMIRSSGDSARASSSRAALFPIVAVLFRQGLFRMHRLPMHRAERQADPQPPGRCAGAIAAAINQAFHLQLAVLLRRRPIGDALFLAVRAGRLEIQPGIGEGAEFGRQGV